MPTKRSRLFLVNCYVGFWNVVLNDFRNSIILFAGLADIGGGYFWGLWLREGKSHITGGIV